MSKRNIHMVLQYDGSRYRGWQRLGDSDKTIQGKLEELLTRITGEPVEVVGSGRTDAGVHALGQSAHFTTSSIMPAEALAAECNKYLPEDIVLLSAVDTDPRFHARYQVKSKKYIYRIRNATLPDVFQRKYQWHIPEPLKLQAMEECVAFLTGSHDFTSFTSAKPGKKSMERELYSIQISRIGGLLELTFHGNGFLHNMVRILTGTLVEAGRGNLYSGHLPRIFEEKQRSSAGPMAPPHGLFLAEVTYS